MIYLFPCAKIYIIICEKTGKIYIGSTNKSLDFRLAQHLACYKSYIKGTNQKYCCSFEIIEEGQYKIELLKYFPCNTKQELTAEEGQYIRSMDCINKKIEGRTQKEWYEDNKERIKERNAENKDKIQDYNKQHYKDNKDKRITYQLQYQKDNREAHNEYQKKYQRANNRYKRACAELRSISIFEM